MAKGKKAEVDLAWVFAWKRKVNDIRRLGCGTCSAYQKQVDSLVDKLEELVDKIAKSRNIK